MEAWHYVREGRQVGPVTREELQRLAASGGLDRSDVVWTQGMETWSQAGAVAGIFPAEAARLEYAGFGVRFAARLIDYLCLLVFGFASGIAGGLVLGVLAATGRIDPGWAAKLHEKSPLTAVFGIAAMVCYHAFCEGLSGATLGKLACGLLVLGPDGAPASVTAGFVRSLAFFVDSLFFGLVAYLRMSKSPSLQRYGDAWAGTVVVKADGAPAASRRSGAAFAGALALGGGGAVLLNAAGILLKTLL